MSLIEVIAILHMLGTYTGSFIAWKVWKRGR